MENQKKMSLVDLVYMGIGGCIGAGIFSMLGVGIGYTGRSVALAFIIAMILKMTQQIRSIIMASMFSLSGGSYSQSALILTPMLTGASAISTLSSAFSFSVFGISLSSYTVVLIPALKPYETLLSCAYLVLFFVIASTGVNIFAKVQNLLGTSKIIALLMFIVFAIMKRGEHVAEFSGEPLFYNGIGSFVIAIAMMSFTCDGITNIVNVSSMAENPKKNIPKAWVLASLICGSIYALLGFAGSGLGAYADVANQNLGYLAQLVLPAPLYIFFVVGGAMAALSTALLGGITGMGPMMQGIAQDGWLPKFFLKKTNVFIVMCVGSILPIISSFTLDNIVSMIMVPSLVLGVITSLRAMKLPEMFPEEWKNTGFNISPAMFRILMWISIVASLLTSVFSLMSLTLPLAIGTIGAIIAIYVYANYMIKSGKVNITSTQDLG